MKVVAIIQARMGSTRLPGKVLLDLSGKTVLARVIERLRRAKSVDELLVATTDRPEDDAIVEACNRLSVASFRGQENDVLDRYHQAALSVDADVIVRITSDCPLIDPELVDQTVRTFTSEAADYASNCLDRRYPRGLDTEVIRAQALARAWREARQPYEREHVTPYLPEHSAQFKLASLIADADYSHHRWTVDTPEDLELVRAIYQRLGPGEFLWRDVLTLLDREPVLVELNRGVPQKVLHTG